VQPGWETKLFGGGRFGCGFAEAVVSAMKDNRWDFDLRPFRQLLLPVQETLFTRSVEVAVTVGVKDAIDEVWIIERLAVRLYIRR